MEPNVQFLVKITTVLKQSTSDILLLVYVNHAVTYRKQDY